MGELVFSVEACMSQPLQRWLRLLLYMELDDCPEVMGSFQCSFLNHSMAVFILNLVISQNCLCRVSDSSDTEIIMILD